MNLRAVEALVDQDVWAPVDNVLEHPLLSEVEILYVQEGGALVECRVPTALIDHEEVPVEEGWARDLAKNMRANSQGDNDSGQLQTISLGVIEGEDTFKIIDGFHRDAALEINGEEFRNASVRLTDWVNLYDMRIFTAKDHPHVRFSRVVQWIQKAWALSDLASKISVEQAILLYTFKTSGARLNLQEDDIALVNEWVQRKEALWNMSAMTMREHLVVAEHVDPQLVHSTREKIDSHSLNAPTQAIIKIFSKHLPDNFVFQNLVMEVAKQHNLRGPDVRGLCDLVRDCPDHESAQTALESVDWATWVPSYEETKTRQLRRAYDPRYKGAQVFERTTEDVARVRERLQLTIQRREEVDEEMEANLKAAHRRANELIGELQVLGRLFSDVVSLRPVPMEDEITPPKSSTRPQPKPSLSSTPSSPAPPPPVEQGAATTKGTSPFMDELRNYLNGTSEDFPPIITEQEIRKAERVLQENFSGLPILREDIHEEISKARKELRRT